MRQAIYAFLVFAGAVSAAPAIKAAAVDVPPGGFAMLAVDGADGGTAVWSVSPDATQEAEIAGVFVFTGRPGGTYTVTALVVDFDARKVRKLRQVVRFLGEPGPSPPGPGPQPPTPDPPKPPPLDPLAKALKDAAAADGWPAAKLAALATGFKVAADRVASRETLADMVAVAKAALKESSPDPTPPGVRGVLAKELAALDGPDRQATDDDKAKVKALFLKLGTALSEAAK